MVIPRLWAPNFLHTPAVPGFVVPGFIILSTLLFLVLGPAGCGDDNLKHPNLVPDTEIVTGPGEGSITEYRVAIHWTGFDPDGEVDHFEWRISNNGIDGILDHGDTLGLPWRVTTAWDSVFVVSADEFFDPADPMRANQTHTFFVRAVDALGAHDPSPAHVSFTAFTWTPQIHIDRPINYGGNSCVRSSTAVAFGWEASDPDGHDGVPVQVRWALVRVDELDPIKLAEAGVDPLEPGSCLTSRDVEQLSPVSFFPDDAWSEWLEYRVEEEPSAELQIPGLPLDSSWFIAVQARDEAGAVSPTFRWARNLWHFRVTDGRVPRLTLTEGIMGYQTFKDAESSVDLTVLAGDTFHFQWIARVDEYLGEVEEYRHGWNVSDPSDDDDPAWDGGWSLHLEAEPYTIPIGPSNFYLQARDTSGGITNLCVDLYGEGDPDGPTRDLIVVEDWGLGDIPSELSFQQEWSDRLDRQLAAGVSGYSPDQDHIVIMRMDEGPSVETLARYQNIIWGVDGVSEDSWLRRAVVRPISSGLHYNPLYAHQRLRGGLLLTGPAAALAALNYPMFYDFYMPLPIDLRDNDRYDTGDIPSRPNLFHTWLWQSWRVKVLDTVRCSSPSCRWAGSDPPEYRNYSCDVLVHARASETLTYLGLPDLGPEPGRGHQSPTQPIFAVQQIFEEFYDRDLPLGNGDAETEGVVMYRFGALRDADWFVEPEDGCPPSPTGASLLDGAVCGLYVTSMPALDSNRESAQVLWGFHPMGFDEEQMGGAVTWVCRELWGLPGP